MMTGFQIESQYIIGYVAVMSLITCLVFGYDKGCAKRGKWRVPERTLFLLAALGGAPGAYAGMLLFRHKTKHWKFRMGIPVLIVVWAILVVLLVVR